MHVKGVVLMNQYLVNVYPGLAREHAFNYGINKDASHHVKSQGKCYRFLRADGLLACMLSRCLAGCS